MIIIWLLLITNIRGQEINNVDPNDALPIPNVTTLYPVSKNKTKIIEGKTSWKLEATFGESSLEKKKDGGTGIQKEQDNNNTIIEEQARGFNDSKEFKPSQPLGSFVDEEKFTESYRIVGNEESGFQFFNSHKDESFPTFKPSPEDTHTPTEFPYKFHNTIYKPKDTWTPDALEPRPTVEIPVHVPAGGLYKLEDPFTVHPGIGFDEDYGLEIKDHVKVKHIRKRVNPWQSVLRLMTALVPVGIIISALTPSVITVHSTGPEARHLSHFLRRSDTSVNEMPAVSERCRRRLLCELHSEANFEKSQSERRKGKYCYKIYCEDPHTVWIMLQWLLTHHQPRNSDERRYFS